MSRPFVTLALSLTFLMAVAAVCSATPSGLNNIPTADVVDTHLFVIQAFSQFGEDKSPSWFAGAKYGVAERWEIGIDDLFTGPGSKTGPALQTKYRLALPHRGALALGAANLTSDTDRNGEIFPYAVASLPLGRSLRGHLGYSWQRDNAAWFIGADTSVTPKITLRADWTQVMDGDESVTSLGFIAPLATRWLIEAWGSFPTADGAASDYIIKLDYLIPSDRG